jgi:ABC-type antimicrobial peptide transport system permease subunit
VSQRTQEIGVRMALGASGQEILSMVFTQGLRQLAIGLAVGLLAAWGVTRVLSSLLVQVSPVGLPDSGAARDERGSGGRAPERIAAPVPVSIVLRSLHNHSCRTS